uniref:Carboxylic ester hydrolase n=1 Tax=Kwoniella dejecticola CBS 10117 TaxID=1296121 RepID=A0A1A6A002_9TREE|nr:uncharacterized protein I303_06947 [Kwoniella dejecticola CBS 10117]OBR83382.1 hypothetical protein I303_06947 [Kwoniella dejecticola CBS 10117]
MWAVRTAAIAILSLGAASPLRRQAQQKESSSASPPTATISPSSANGKSITVQGVIRPNEDFDSYMGIPFGQPPVDELRWKPSQLFDYGTIDSVNGSDYRQACIQLSLFGADSPTPDNAGAAGTSEDCLFLNVFTPRGASSSEDKLPVWVSIYGGGFLSGSAQAGDPVNLIPTANEMGLPVVYVTFNYRLGGFGFVSGPQFAESDSGNLGASDVTTALQWVQENIEAFGGDPKRVTIQGQSAGASQVSLQYLQPDLELFQYGIIQSGAPSLSTLGPIAQVQPQAWNRFFELLNCSDSRNDQVQCAQKVNTTVVVDAYTQLFKEFNRGNLIGQTIDGVILPATPYSLLGQGRYAHRPFIVGDVKDEGTVFATATNESSFISSIQGSGLFTRSNETVQKLLELYADVPAEGSPFDTGDELFNKTSTYKRASAYSGDVTFQVARRNWLDVTHSHGLVDSWNYEYSHVAANVGANPAQGVFHGAELNITRGRPTEGKPWWTEQDINLSKALRFIYQGNPNQVAGDNAIIGSTNITTDAFVPWPSYNGPEERNTILFEGAGRSVVKDDFRTEQFDYINSQNTEYSR